MVASRGVYSCSVRGVKSLSQECTAAQQYFWLYLDEKSKDQKSRVDEEPRMEMIVQRLGKTGDPLQLEFPCRQSRYVDALQPSCAALSACLRVRKRRRRHLRQQTASRGQGCAALRCTPSQSQAIHTVLNCEIGCAIWTTLVR